MKLCVEGGCFAYEKGGRQVIQDISFEVNSGDILAVLGPNGQLQKDWDTGVQLATSTEGGPACLSSYGYQQREGYAGFYVSGTGDTDGTMYELNLATGEVTPAENP